MDGHEQETTEAYCFSYPLFSLKHQISSYNRHQDRGRLREHWPLQPFRGGLTLRRCILQRRSVIGKISRLPLVILVDDIWTSMTINMRHLWMEKKRHLTQGRVHQGAIHHRQRLLQILRNH